MRTAPSASRPRSASSWRSRRGFLPPFFLFFLEGRCPACPAACFFASFFGVRGGEGKGEQEPERLVQGGGGLEKGEGSIGAGRGGKGGRMGIEGYNRGGKAVRYQGKRRRAAGVVTHPFFSLHPALPADVAGAAAAGRVRPPGPAGERGARGGGAAHRRPARRQHGRAAQNRGPAARGCAPGAPLCPLFVFIFNVGSCSCAVPAI